MTTQAPSDRYRTAPVLGLGVDTIALRGPAHPDLIEQLPERRFQQVYDDVTGEMTDLLRSGHTAVPVGDTWVRLFADRRNGPPEVRLEFSVPALLAGHNRDPLDLSYLPDAVDATLTEVSRNISGMPSYDQLRPVRLDIARDFRNVKNPSRTLAAVSRLPVARAARNSVERRADGAVQTLTRGSGSRWLVRGYDKFQQMLDVAQREPTRKELLVEAAAGHERTLRVEVQFKSQLLRDRGMTRVDDIDRDAMHALTEAYFRRSRFGDVVGGSDRLREAITLLINSNRAPEARGVSALLLAELHGYAPPLSRNTLAKARAAAREFGLTVVDVIGDDSDSRRLDFWTGAEVGAETGR